MNQPVSYLLDWRNLRQLLEEADLDAFDASDMSLDIPQVLEAVAEYLESKSILED